MATEVDTLVADYLNRLRMALASLPGTRQTEITEAVAQHIDEARFDGEDNEAAVRTVLDHLGSPEDIASAALDDESVVSPKVPRKRPSLPAFNRRLATWGVAILALCTGGIIAGFTLSSSTQALIMVPNVTGIPSADAISKLHGHGFAVDVHAVMIRTGMRSGEVVEQMPISKLLPAGYLINIWVDTVRPNATITVPNVVGLELAQATATLRAAGLTETSVKAVSPSVGRNDVVAQTPPAGVDVGLGVQVALSVNEPTADSEGSTTTTTLSPTTTTVIAH